jgi:hypothetical protein
MMFYTKEAKETAVKEISRLYVKLAETSPTDQWHLQDIESVMFYLQTMKEELNREIKNQKV